MNVQAEQKNRNIVRNEDGFGFLESLIAIIVAGIACVALLTIAVGVIREAKKNEVRDAMNQYAIEGLEYVRKYSSSDYSIINGGSGLCDAASPTGTYAYLDLGDEIPTPPNDLYIEAVLKAERCSEGQNTCEKLPLPDESGARDIFYREITLLRHRDHMCKVVRVTVTVGLLDPESLKIEPVSMVGYIAE